MAIVTIAYAPDAYSIKYGSAPNKKRIEEYKKQKLRSPPQTRGVTRGGKPSTPPVCRVLVDPGTPSLPPYLGEFDIEFSRQKEGELHVPYGRDDDPNSFYFFVADQFEGRQKIAIQKELGFEWLDLSQPPTRAPGWMDLARNYRNLLIQSKIDSKNFIVPALVLYRTVDTKKQYLMIDPFVDSFPPESEGYKALTSNVEFNLPFYVISDGLRNGKFPLLDAVHDVSHFVAFYRFPEFTKNIVSQFRRFKSESFTPAFKRRQYWLTEALSLPNPNSLESAKEFLRSKHRPLAPKTLSDLRNSMTVKNKTELLDYALEISTFLESTLLDVSGGSSSSPEKYFYLSEVLGLRADAVANGTLSPNGNVYGIVSLFDTIFKNQPVTFAGNPKQVTNETAVFNFQIIASSLRYLSLALKENNPQKIAIHFADPAGRFTTNNGNRSPIDLKKGAEDELLEMVKVLIAASEFILVKGASFSIQEWVETFLQPDLESSHPISQFLLEVFPNNIVRDYYLGRGLVRQK